MDHRRRRLADRDQAPEGIDNMNMKVVAALAGFAVGFVVYPVPDFLTQALLGGVPGAIIGGLACAVIQRRRRTADRETHPALGAKGRR